MASRFQPLINGHDGEGQINEFRFAELLSHALEEFVRDMISGDQRQGPRPSERRAFPLGEKRSLAPGVQLWRTARSRRYRALVPSGGAL